MHPPAITRPVIASQEARPRRKWLTAHNYKYFIRGQSEKAAEEAHVVLKQRRARLQPYDRMLRRFQHRDALDAALETRNPDTVDAVLAVLAQRGAFDSAIGGREAAQLVPLLAHLRKHIGDPRYSASLLQAAARVVDLYAGTLGQVPEVDSLFLQLRDEMAAEVRMQQKLMEVQGTLEPILARSYIATAGGA